MSTASVVTGSKGGVGARESARESENEERERLRPQEAREVSDSGVSEGEREAGKGPIRLLTE